MKPIICEFCGKAVPSEQAHEYEGMYVCDDCWEDEFTECERCGTRISYDDAYRGFHGYLCEHCYHDLFD